jgi:GDP-6-deoxy-D-talose 4-dehydrogenase
VRVLVTGASGFTGLHLVRVLRAAGADVHDLGDANLLDQESLTQRVTALQPEAVVHLAAIAFAAHGNVDELYRTNVVGTRNLLAALAVGTRRLEKIILASSANIYGNAQIELIDESISPQPTNDYAISKLAMEWVASLWRDRLPIIVARPFNYTGPGQSKLFVVPKLVDHFARRAASIELGNMVVWREYNDVAGVADVYSRLLTKGASGETYNLCSGRLLSLAEIFQCMRELTGHDMEIRINPEFVRAGEVTRLGGNPAKLKNVLGELHWSPMQELFASMLAVRTQELNSV